MRTTQYLQEAPLRAARRIEEARAHYDLSIYTIARCLREFTDGPVTADDARRLAPVLGMLTVAEQLTLMDEGFEALRSAAQSYVWEAQRAIEERLGEIDDLPPHKYQLPISRLQRPAPVDRGALSRIALALEAVVWSVSPPEEYIPPIVY